MKKPWTESTTGMFTAKDLEKLQTEDPEQFSKGLFTMNIPLSAIDNIAVAGIEELLAHGDYLRAQLLARHLLGQDYKLLGMYKEQFNTPDHDLVEFLLTGPLAKA